MGWHFMDQTDIVRPIWIAKQDCCVVDENDGLGRIRTVVFQGPLSRRDFPKVNVGKDLKLPANFFCVRQSN